MHRTPKQFRDEARVSENIAYDALEKLEEAGANKVLVDLIAEHIERIVYLVHRSQPDYEAMNDTHDERDEAFSFGKLGERYQG